MAKEKVEGLLSLLHDKLNAADTSPQQDALLQQMQSHLADWEGPLPADGNIVATAELLRETLEEKHPHLSRILKEIIDALGRIGI
ncbi:MAG TPA: DUF4404 family protein [Pseudomonadaceae bacterium]|nr:DUF4404 family protein [Pseudomonadaceae bacterium]